MSGLPNRIEIPMFPGGKRIAVTTSWDDGTIHDRRVVAGLNEYGLKGTFNLNSGKLIRAGVGQSGQWHNYIAASDVAALYAGHEVAVHTVTHPWLEKLDRTQIATEVLEDRKALEELVGYPVRGMAYPFGTYNAEVLEVLRAVGIVYSRTCVCLGDPWPTAEPLTMPTTMHMFHTDPLPVAERFADCYERRNRSWSGLFYVWGHSYEFEDRKDWAALERLFKPLGGKPDVWYCTNIELWDYHAARQRVVTAANRGSAYNPSGQAVTLKVDGKLVDVPAGQTIRLG